VLKEFQHWKTSAEAVQTIDSALELQCGRRGFRRLASPVLLLDVLDDEGSPGVPPACVPGSSAVPGPVSRTEHPVRVRQGLFRFAGADFAQALAVAAYGQLHLLKVLGGPP